MPPSCPSECVRPAPSQSFSTPLLLGLVLLGAGVGRCLSFPFVSTGHLALWAGQAAVIWIGAFRSLVQAASSAAQPYFCESSVRVPISQAASSPSPHPHLPSYLTEQGEASSVNSPSCHLLPQLAGLPGFLFPSLTSGETGSLVLPRAVIWMLLFLRFPPVPHALSDLCQLAPLSPLFAAFCLLTSTFSSAHYHGAFILKQDLLALDPP